MNEEGGGEDEDEEEGGVGRVRRQQNVRKNAGMFLSSTYVSVPHPCLLHGSGTRGTRITVELPMPKKFQTLLDRCRRWERWARDGTDAGAGRDGPEMGQMQALGEMGG